MEVVSRYIVFGAWLMVRDFTTCIVVGIGGMLDCVAQKICIIIIMSIIRSMHNVVNSSTLAKQYSSPKELQSDALLRTPS